MTDTITTELRKWAGDNTLQDMVLTTYPPQHAVHGVLEMLLRIADRIDAEHESAVMSAMNDALYHANDESMAELGWVRLPKDADGEYIRVGDVVEYIVCPSTHREVTGVGVECFYAWEDGYGRYSQFDANCYRHHHAPTVEDVLTEFGIDWEHESDCEDRAALLKEYASKLKLAEGEDA